MQMLAFQQYQRICQVSEGSERSRDLVCDVCGYRLMYDRLWNFIPGIESSSAKKYISGGAAVTRRLSRYVTISNYSNYLDLPSHDSSCKSQNVDQR